MDAEVAGGEGEPAEGVEGAKPGMFVAEFGF